MATRMRPSDEHGFTLIEVLVGIVLLLVGVLGVVALVDGANAVTSKTKAREGGTNIARSIIEVSRSLRYRDLTADELLAALDARPGLEDVSASPGHTIRLRNVDYRLTLTVCSLDDPKDNLGVHPSGVVFCTDSEAGTTLTDRNPDDYKRVRVTLTWTTRGNEASVTQTSSIINPVGGLGPSVVGLTMTSPGSSSDPLRIDSNVTQASFTAVTSTSAADLRWSVDGNLQLKPDGGPITWTFDWEFLDASGEIAYHDCTYVIQAEAFDEQGRAGSPYARTVVVNRDVALPVESFDGGRNGNGERVDLQWIKTPECDVVGYRVYRDDDPLFGSPELVSCTGQVSATYTEELDCVDESAPAGTLYYRVRALDTSAAGAIREGAWSSQLTVDGSNALPTVPQNVSTCVGGQLDCNGPDGTPAPTGAIVVRWDPSTDSDGTVDFYRIYRDGSTYGDRHDVFFPDPGIAWFEPEEPDGQSHTYRISAVDDDFGESGLSDPVSAG
jgi:prepilin-type N-terminal cleavage/methylation domain-containing protein